MMPLTIDKLYAWVCEEDDGKHGLIAFLNPNGMSMPLVGADMERIESFREYAEQIAHEFKKKIFLMEFSHREILETINPHNSH